MSDRLLLLGLLLLRLAVMAADAFELDNSLLEQPKISCEESRIRMSIRTRRPFGGNVYAKGFFNKDSCRVQGNGHGHLANITIPVNADCGMRRKRNVGPQLGLSLEIDVIMMFHGRFLTKNDRAFHVECQYVEMDQRVGNRLDVSALPSTELSHTLLHVRADVGHKPSRVPVQPSALPKCHYEVLSVDSGRPISFAAIGQPVLHRWSCGSAEQEGAEGSQYCLTVHSCEVDDGQGSAQKLLDEKGCPTDKGLFGAIEYKSDLEAQQRGLAFKFADRPTIYFSCQLRLELRQSWKECQRTADVCAVVAAPSPAPAGLEKVREGAAMLLTSEQDGGQEPDEYGNYSPPADFPTPSPTFPSAGSGFHQMSAGTTSSSYLRVDNTPQQYGKAEEAAVERMGSGNSVHTATAKQTLALVRRTRSTTPPCSTTTTSRPAPVVQLPHHSEPPPEHSFRELTDSASPPPPASSSVSDSSEDEPAKEEDAREGQEEHSQQYAAAERRLYHLRQRSTTPLEMEKMSKMSERSSSSNFVDIDVSHAVDVLDVVASGSSENDAAKAALPSHRQTTHQLVDPAHQLCVSRQLLTTGFFLAVLCLLSMLTVLCCSLLSCSSAGAAKPLASYSSGAARLSAVLPRRFSQRVLDAYNA